MMCTCRTAALRLFVRSFAQLHIADALPASSTSSLLRPSVRGYESYPRLSRALGVGALYRRPYSTALSQEEASTTSSPSSHSTASPPAQQSENGALQPQDELPQEQEQVRQQQDKDEVTDASDQVAVEHDLSQDLSSIAELTPESFAAFSAEIEADNARLEEELLRAYEQEATSSETPSETPSHDEPPKKKKPRWRDDPTKVHLLTPEAKQSRAAAAALQAIEASASKSASEEVAAAADRAERKSKRRKGMTEDWQVQKHALAEKFGEEGWNPRKKLSPDALTGIRALHKQFPEVYTTAALSKKFEVSPEVIRRVLRSKWTPTTEEEERRQERWFSRGKDIWTRWAELGRKPPAVWRQEGIRSSKRGRHQKSLKQPQSLARRPIRGVPVARREAFEDGNALLRAAAQGSEKAWV